MWRIAVPGLTALALNPEGIMGLSTNTSKNVNKKQGKGKSTLKGADVAGRDELF